MVEVGSFAAPSENKQGSTTAQKGQQEHQIKQDSVNFCHKLSFLIAKLIPQTDLDFQNVPIYQTPQTGSSKCVVR